MILFAEEWSIWELYRHNWGWVRDYDRISLPLSDSPGVLKAHEKFILSGRMSYRTLLGTEDGYETLVRV